RFADPPQPTATGQPAPGLSGESPVRHWRRGSRRNIRPRILVRQEIADLGEVNMGDPSTLVDFATWAINSYPADRFALILSDHGAGWLGGWSDKDNNDEDGLFMSDIEDALAQIVTQTGIGKLDLVGFDACLMAQIESFSTIAPYARYAVASEEVEPSIGWAYTGFLQELVNNPAMSGRELAQTIVDNYIDQDQRIVNDYAREQYLEEAYSFTGSITAEELAFEEGSTTTLSAVDLEALPELHSALNSLLYTLTSIDQTHVAQARTYAQSYYSLFRDVPPSYIDLEHFVRLLVEETGSHEVSAAADVLYAAIDRAVVAEKHGAERPGSHGISIYFPNSELYTSVYGYQMYTTMVDRFADVSQWDDFLAFHYSGQTFQPDSSGPVTPPDNFTLQVPGGGPIEMSALLQSAETIYTGESIMLETELTGNNIGYIYFFAGLYVEESDTLMAIDADFILADSTTEIDGVVYPDWGDSGVVGVSVEWYPTLYYINDGFTSEFAVLYPLYYGATTYQMVYAVDGSYTFADSREQIYAVMTFGSDGWMQDVYSINLDSSAEGPRQITPKQGDTFTLSLKAIALPETEDGDPEFIEFDGGTLTFGTTSFYWEDYAAIPGEYVVGIGALDLDGNYNLDFVPVSILE
ncbi:MAG: clostripain-related cysteine peptidase, partial [Anaerolineaceae bacterium]|nr:clostripain-related cysteine peptidase [Anaerolineaceae bacterium]